MTERGGAVDIGVIAGLAVAIVAVLGANAIDGGRMAALLNPSAALLIIGGTLGTTLISSRLEDVIGLPKVVMGLIRPARRDLPADVERLVELAQKARRSGLLALEEDIANLDDPFLARGLQMVVDGADADAVRGVLRTEMVLKQQTIGRQATVLETAGGFAPTMGIIGTVMGLIHVLANLANVSKLGPSIATAFLATFYGISTANVLWLPLANKLRLNAKASALAYDVALEGVLSIQAGDNPSAVRDKLTVFLQGSKPPRNRGDVGQEPADKSGNQVA